MHQTGRWLRIASCWCAGVVAVSGNMLAGDAESTTTVFVIRHAEKAATPKSDPPITQAGRARADLLVGVLRSAKLSGVYTSGFARTDQTGQPLADAANVNITKYDPRQPHLLASAIMRDHAGRSVLVVGHSNTVPGILDALGVDKALLPTVGDDEYDSLFVVTIRGGQVSLVHLRFGTPLTKRP